MQRPYWRRVGDSLSQMFNTLILNGEPDETTSGRSYRRGVIEGSRRWRWSMRIIDGIFSTWEKDHCRKAHEADIQRAKVLVQRTQG